MMNVEQSVEWELAGETEVLWGNLLQCYVFHHKSYYDLGSIPGRRGGKPAINRLNYGMAQVLPKCDTELKISTEQ
jgi:hypothetical protein